MAKVGKGKAESLDKAFRAAWDDTDKDKDTWYTAEIEVQGDNPIKDYRVTLTPRS